METFLLFYLHRFLIFSTFAPIFDEQILNT